MAGVSFSGDAMSGRYFHNSKAFKDDAFALLAGKFRTEKQGTDHGSWQGT